MNDIGTIIGAFLGALIVPVGIMLIVLFDKDK